MHPMRVRAIGALLVAGALLGAVPASALARDRTIEFRTSGALKVLWHGDPARGCAEAGMCGYSGTIDYPRRPQAFIEWFGPSGREFDPAGSTGLLDMTGPTRVRVRREVPGGAPATCRASNRFAAFTLDISHAYRDRLWLTLGTRVFPGPTVAGQCAGPLLADIAPALPSAPVRLRHLARRGARVSLAGRFPFHRGPISGEVVSTLRMRSEGARTEHENTHFGPEHVDRHRRLFVDLTFRIESAEGEVRSDFRAIDAPICARKDACGTHGSEVYSFTQGGGTVEVFGAMRTNAKHAPSLRRAIRRIARHAGLEGFAYGGHVSALTTDVLLGPGRPQCTDRRRSGRPFLDLGGHRRLTARLSFDAPLLEGRCPGPTDEQSLGGRLATGHLGLGQLARRSPELALHANRSYKAGAFRGRHAAHVSIRLRRVRARVRVVKPARDGSIRISRVSARSAL
jgi:hypothetical protein